MYALWVEHHWQRQHQRRQQQQEQEQRQRFVLCCVLSCQPWLLQLMHHSIKQAADSSVQRLLEADAEGETAVAGQTLLQIQEQLVASGHVTAESC
jgi:hypothetical protein